MSGMHPSMLGMLRSSCPRCCRSQFHGIRAQTMRCAKQSTLYKTCKSSSTASKNSKVSHPHLVVASDGVGPETGNAALCHDKCCPWLCPGRYSEVHCTVHCCHLPHPMMQYCQIDSRQGLYVAWDQDLHASVSLFPERTPAFN